MEDLQKSKELLQLFARITKITSLMTYVLIAMIIICIIIYWAIIGKLPPRPIRIYSDLVKASLMASILFMEFTLNTNKRIIQELIDLEEKKSSKS